MKLVIYSNLHGVAPAIQQLIQEHSQNSDVWNATEVDQLRDLLTTVEPSVVAVGERGLFDYLALESKVFGSQLPPYKRMVISYISPASTELWGAELGFDGMIDGADNVHSIMKTIHAVEDGQSLLRSNPAYQLPMVFNEYSSTLLRYSDSIDEQIVIMIASGLEDRAIAERVFLPIQELRNRIQRLIASAQIKNRTQLAVLYSRGLIDTGFTQRV